MTNWLQVIAGRAPLPVDMEELSDLVQFADAHHVLGQMAWAYADRTEGKLKEVLENGLLRTGFDHRMLQFEMDRIERALMGSGIQPILLKGAAYVATGSQAGHGRRVSDIDILVSEAELAETEKLLSAAGWSFDMGVDNDYDLLYYRTYMHELPPLRHTKRRTILDVHHSLLPRTSRVKIDSTKMQKAAVPIEGTKLKRLTVTDLFIHSAVHTFADGSFDTPARSLLELHHLLNDLSEDELFGLLKRAGDVGAEMPVGTALWALDILFGDVNARTIRANNMVRTASGLVRWALASKLDNVDDAQLAKFILFVRSHWLRMPMHLLSKHLLQKLIRRLQNLGSKEDPLKSQ